MDLSKIYDDDDWEYVKKHQMTEEELEENLKYFRNHPIFMKDQPEDISQNIEFQALQNLAYDDTPENVARNCNERGNALYRKNPEILYYIKEAFKAYEEGIEIKCNDIEINIKLLSNRTLINFKLKNYGRVIADCKKIIEMNKKFIKAYFRYGSALLFVNRVDEALKIVEQGLKIENDNKELLGLKDEISKRVNGQYEKEKEKASKKDKEFKRLIEQAMKKNILLGQKNMLLPEVYEQILSFDEQNILHTPMLIYYPEFQQTDFIQEVLESDILLDHLSEVFKTGLPWDSNGDYTDLKQLKCFVHLNSTIPYYRLKGYDPKMFDPQIQTFKPIEMKSLISSIMGIPGHVIPMFLEIYIVSEKSKFFNIFISYNKIMA